MSSVRRNLSQAAARPLALPRLPVPDLQKTLQKYLKSLEPVLSEHEARGGPSLHGALEERRRWADEFAAGLGARCQERLIELDKASPRNWLDDNFWPKKAYHEWRSPLLINTNWWLALCNDKSFPISVLNLWDVPDLAGITLPQVRRAAWLVHRTIEFKDKLARQEVYPETTRTGLWFRDTAAMTFNTCRIPLSFCDALSPRPDSSSLNGRKITLMVHDWVYAIDVYETDGRQTSPRILERRLLDACNDAAMRLSKKEYATPVGILTSDDRDRWAENYRHLQTLSPTNERTLEAIQQSILMVSLDSHTLVSPTDPSKKSQSLFHTIDTPAEIDSHLHNIRSSLNGRNRWFDKAYTLIVESNTRAGAMGEHSPCDALVPSIIAEYSIVEDVSNEEFDDPQLLLQATKGDGPLASSGWERLDFVTDDRIRRECEEAQSRARLIIEDSDDSVLWFDAYGSDWIKNVARQSPDAYVQMALQLAWYRTRGTFTATYETVLTRLFDRGRTETIRTLTADSRAFVLAMEDPHQPVRINSMSTRHSLLRRAIQTHTALSREGATGKGIDRHLLGLRLMMREGEESKLFDDKIFEESQTWKLSTSGLSAGHLFRGTGFGSPYHDGYGINYLCGPDVLKFGVESKHSCSETSTSVFQSAIWTALEDMKAVCLYSHSLELPAVARL
ncbi:carnitine acetyltransferase [Amylostereum chailletii]|nr:carnitine acetyltransferase [Amylostereum chailletii]